MTGLAKREKRIGNAVFTVHQLPFGESRPLFWLGASILAPALEVVGKVNIKKLLDGDTSELLEGGDFDVGAVGKAFKIFFDRASFTDFERFEEAFAKNTFVKVDGTKAAVSLATIRELHWPTAGYGAFVQWFVFCVQVNFFPFSTGSGLAAGESPAASTP